MKRGGQLRRRRKVMSAAERVYKDRFDELVLAKRPIVVDPSKKRGIVDAHHVLPKSWLRSHVSTLEPEEGWAIIWDADNGLPVDRGRHDDITVAHRRLKVVELRPENIDFAIRHDLLHLLEREVPTFSRTEC